MVSDLGKFAAQRPKASVNRPFELGRDGIVSFENVPAEQQTRRTRVLFWLSLIVPLSLYIGFASRFIGAHVGYQYDEALFVESAVFVLRGTPDLATWIAGHGRRWPLMIIPYMGTTKACVALPLFATLGISAEVARFSGV